MRSGSREACATGGEGSCSITETSTAVERGSQAEKIDSRIALESLDRSIYGGSLMESDFVIFSIKAGSLGESRSATV